MLVRLLAAVVACGAASAFAADPVPVTREFKIVIASEEGHGGEKVSGESEYRYAWQRTGKERTLLLREMATRDKKPDGKVRVWIWNRAGTITTEDGKATKEEKYADFSDERKKLARELFDSPLCKLEVDETGKVTKRTDTRPKAAKDGVADVIATVMLFHAPYHVAKDRWEGEGTLVRDPRMPAAGKLEYTKVAGGKGGQAVRATGKLRSKFPPDGIKDVKDEIPVARYGLTGTLTFNEQRGEWIAGKFDIETETEWIKAGKGDLFDPPNKGDKGKMTITFELLPEKK